MLFLDTANIEELTQAKELGILTGFTTNPSILENESMNEFTLVQKTKHLGYELIFFQVKGEDSQAMIEYFMNLKDTLPINFGVKVPITLEGLKVVKHIKETSPESKILGTVVYTAAQGILAAMAGCDYVAPYYNRIAQEGGNPNEVIHSIRQYVDDTNSTMKILAASFKSSHQIVDALLHGAHTCTISYPLLVQLLTSKSVEQDLLVFNNTKY